MKCLWLAFFFNWWATQGTEIKSDSLIFDSLLVNEPNLSNCGREIGIWGNIWDKVLPLLQVLKQLCCSLWRTSLCEVLEEGKETKREFCDSMIFPSV